MLKQKALDGGLRLGVAFGMLALAGMLSGCVAVGYTSGGGWFIWPGGLGLLVVILFVVFLLRRRG